jgi:DNA-binding NarL/FixJ family response regulator
VGDVARLLGLSAKTVSTHREHILRKLGFTNNMEIIRFCLRQGLLGDPELPG